MNLFVTIARTGKDFQILSGPEVPAHVQRAQFHKLVLGSNTEKLDEIQMWSSTRGRCKRHKFKDFIQVRPFRESNTPSAASDSEDNTSVTSGSKSSTSAKSTAKAGKPKGKSASGNQPSTSDSDPLS